MERNPNISSHSFRIGFITQLWKNTNDIELVRHVIGNVEIDITSQEVENISEKNSGFSWGGRENISETISGFIWGRFGCLKFREKIGEYFGAACKFGEEFPG